MSHDTAYYLSRAKSQALWMPFVCALLIALSAIAQAAPRTGTLASLVTELVSPDYLLRSPSADPRPYANPSKVLAKFRKAALLMERGELMDAAKVAESFSYEVYEFVDVVTHQHYYVLRENLADAKTSRGWGSYLLNPNGLIPALVEIPHPLDDSNTASIGAQIFAEGAKGLVLAGAHRDKADVPDLVDSPFHQVHVAWIGSSGRVAAWQIHGFARSKHGFPKKTDAVISAGDGRVLLPMIELDVRLHERGFNSFVFNDLKPKSKLNKQLNAGVPGRRFSSLGATQNEQAKYSRQIGSDFVHVELDNSVRSNPEKRRAAAELIAETLARTAVAVAEMAPAEEPTIRLASAEVPLDPTEPVSEPPLVEFPQTTSLETLAEAPTEIDAAEDLLERADAEQIRLDVPIGQ